MEGVTAQGRTGCQPLGSPASASDACPVLRRLSRLLSFVSLAAGALMVVFSLIIAGPTISAGLVVGFMLVVNGAVRLYAGED